MSIFRRTNCIITANFCVVLKIVVLFYVLFVLYCSMYCLCVNVYCHRVTTQFQLTNISYHIISSGIVTLCKGLYSTESDDTRCCDNKICSPENGHVNARNMSRIVM